MAELEVFKFGGEDSPCAKSSQQPEEGTPQPKEGAGGFPLSFGAAQVGDHCGSDRSVADSPAMAADALASWAPAFRSSLGTSSAATILPPSLHSPAASSSQADAAAPSSEVASSLGGGGVLRASNLASPLESTAEGSAAASAIQLTTMPVMERASRIRREAPAKDGFENDFSKNMVGERMDQFDGMHLTPLNQQPFQALSNIARQAHSVLLQRLTPRGRE
jgi:hypothetical protein